MRRVLLSIAALLSMPPIPYGLGQDMAKKFTVGCIHSLTGFGARSGQGELAAVRLAAEEINASGGIQGLSVELRSEDNRSEQRETATAFRKLVSIDKISVLLGPNWAEFAEIAAPLAEQNKIPMLTASAQKSGLVEGRKFVFTLFPPYEKVVQPFVEHLLSQPHKKIAIFVSQNAYYEELNRALRAVLSRHNADVWGEFSFTSEDRDFRAPLSKARAAGVDIIIVLLVNNGSPILLLRQADLIQYPRSQLFFGPSLAMENEVLADKTRAEGVVFFSPISTAPLEFARKFKDATGIEPTNNEAKAYDLLFLVKKAVEKCGTRSEHIAECLRAISHEGASGLIQFENSGQAKAQTSTAGAVLRAQNGMFVRIR